MSPGNHKPGILNGECIPKGINNIGLGPKQENTRPRLRKPGQQRRHKVNPRNALTDGNSDQTRRPDDPHTIRRQAICVLQCVIKFGIFLGLRQFHRVQALMAKTSILRPIFQPVTDIVTQCFLCAQVKLKAKERRRRHCHSPPLLNPDAFLSFYPDREPVPNSAFKSLIWIITYD